jgi:hypothetical protein
VTWFASNTKSYIPSIVRRTKRSISLYFALFCMMRLWCVVRFWLNFEGRYLDLQSSSQSVLHRFCSTFIFGRRCYPWRGQMLEPLCIVRRAYIEMYAKMALFSIFVRPYIWQRPHFSPTVLAGSKSSLPVVLIYSIRSTQEAKLIEFDGAQVGHFVHFRSLYFK